MVLSLASEITSGDGMLDLRRAAIALVVVAAHIALIFVVGRGARHPAEALDIVFLPLPITPEEVSQNPTQVPEPRVSRESEIQPREASPDRGAGASTAPHAEPSPQEPPRIETEIAENSIAIDANPPGEPAAPVDWYAEARTSAESLQQRERIERERRSFNGPKQSLSSPRHTKPACPFERCEPGWGAGFSVFESSKRGRIEKAPDGEVIRWISNRCYQILITPNILHRGMTKCFKPLGKKEARGDLFEHMKKVPLPEEQATDVP